MENALTLRAFKNDPEGQWLVYMFPEMSDIDTILDAARNFFPNGVDYCYAFRRVLSPMKDIDFPLLLLIDCKRVDVLQGRFYSWVHACRNRGIYMFFLTDFLVKYPGFDNPYYYSEWYRGYPCLKPRPKHPEGFYSGK